jgi:predicted transcriptional regulator
MGQRVKRSEIETQRAAVLQVVTRWHCLSATEISEILRRTRGAVLNTLSKLRKDGLVACVGSGHMKSWVPAAMAAEMEAAINEKSIQREMSERKCSRENVLNRRARRAIRAKRDTEVAANGRRLAKDDTPLRVIVSAADRPVLRPHVPASIFELAKYL